MSTTMGRYGDPETRQQILTATWGLIDGGDTEVRLSDVGARAGVSRRAIYLHFGDRAGLLAALVEFMDEVLEADTLAEPVWTATSPPDALAAVVAFYAHINPRVDAVARLLEARPGDNAARNAWRSRMEMRRRIHRKVMTKIADQHALAPEWTLDTAADILHSMMLPATWRELLEGIGWTAEECQSHLTIAVQRAFLRAPT